MKILSLVNLVHEFRAFQTEKTESRQAAIESTIRTLGPVKIDGYILKTQNDTLTITPAKQNDRVMNLVFENGKVIARG